MNASYATLRRVAIDELGWGRRSPTRVSGALRGAISPAAFFELDRSFYLDAELGAETYVFRLRDSATRETKLTPSVTYRTRAGLGKHW